MDFLGLFWHGAGFMAPALVLAPAMVLVSRALYRKAKSRLSWPMQIVINAMVCLGVLVAGVLLTGHDGRMETYAALVLASSGCQAWLTRRRSKK